MGLAISSRLARLMGGELTVESEKDVGSSFHVTINFPIGDDAELNRPSRNAVVVGGTRVLVVDDNATNRRILEEMLKNWGMVPVVADNAPKALSLLREAASADEPFRLLLTDVNMPETDGFSLARFIREDSSVADIPIIMLTSSGRPGDAERRDELCIDISLMKPAKQSEIFDAIVQTLGVSDAEDDPAQPAVQDKVGKIGALRVLLAEDNLVNQKLAQGLLTRQGHTVLIANNGREAIDALQADKFDVVLMDVQMPEMDGFEATRAVRKAEQGTDQHQPIIAMTAHAMAGDRELCLEAGMDEYVSKPIRIAELVDKLAIVLNRDARQASDDRSRSAATPVDWHGALEGVQGDSELLADIIAAFLEESPGNHASRRRSCLAG